MTTAAQPGSTAMASERETIAEIEAVTGSLICVEQYLVEADFDDAAAAVRAARALIRELAALRSKDREREDGALEERVSGQPKAVIFRNLSDEERRSRAEALAKACRDSRASAWPDGCLKPNSCARHRGCMYALSSEQCRFYGADLTDAVDRAEAALPLQPTPKGDGTDA